MIARAPDGLRAYRKDRSVCAILAVCAKSDRSARNHVFYLVFLPCVFYLVFLPCVFYLVGGGGSGGGGLK